MARPKSGKAYEIVSVRLEQGYEARMREQAALRGLSFRDCVRAAFDAYLDAATFPPLAPDAHQAVGRVIRELQSNIRMLREVQRVRPAPPTGGAQEPQRPVEDPTMGIPNVEEPPLPVPTVALVEPGPDVHSAPANGVVALPAGYLLGPLCANEHAYLNTGMSLLTIKGKDCRECKRQRQAAYVARKRAAAAQA
jgi:hypothetical protein